MSEYLDDNRNNLAFRRGVPPDLQPFILNSKGKPRTEWRISLGTTKRREASELCHLWSVKTDREIREAEAGAGRMAYRQCEEPRAEGTRTPSVGREMEAADLASEDLMKDEWEFEEREPIRQALVANLGRPRQELSPSEAAKVAI